MKDAVLFGVLVISFAAFVTAHVSIVGALVVRPPRWRALVATVALPFAPWWAWRENLRFRSVVWMSSVCLYGIARLIG